jgi:threonine aldolase
MIVPSTTMANLIAVMLMTKPGDEVIIWGNAHTIQRESAGIALLCGVQTRQILEETGIFTLEQGKHICLL